MKHIKAIMVITLTLVLFGGGSAWSEEAATTQQHSDATMANIPSRLQAVESALGNTEEQFQTVWTSFDSQYNIMTNSLASDIREMYNNQLNKVLSASQKEYEERCQKLQAAHVGCCGKAIYWFEGFLGVMLGCFFILVWRKNELPSGVFHCLELGLLLGVLLLVSLGTYQLVARFIDSGCNAPLKEIANASNRSSAVLSAYHQLSTEMERFIGLLAVFGTFFGLVLPVGAYFLQTKAVNAQETKTESLIQKQLKDMKQVVDSQLNNLIQAQVNMVRLLVVQQFREIQKPLPPNYGIAQWEYFKWISQMLLLLEILSQTTDEQFMKKQISHLSTLLGIIQGKPFFPAIQSGYVNSGGHIFDFSGDLLNLRTRASSEMAYFEELLEKCSMTIKWIAKN